jgi:hypothetical protein
VPAMTVARALAGLLAAIGLAAAAAPTATGGPTGRVAVATTGNHSEERETIPITRRSGAEPRVAMSLTPRELPSLRQGDRLVFTAELQTTNNCYQPSPFCVSAPYGYSPKIGTRLILASGAGDTGGPDTQAITSRRVRDCDQNPNHREHHCVRVYRSARMNVGNPDALPCEVRECRVNLVVDAYNSRAHDGDLLILGIDRQTGPVSQDRGRLNVTRLRGDGLEVREPATRRRLARRVPIDRGAKRSILSLRLPNLREDEQVTLEAEAKLDIGHLPYSTFVGSQLILATKPGAVRTTALTERVGYLDGHATEANGFNCTQRTTPCTPAKVGTLVLTKTPRRSGRTVPLYVNYVLRNAPKQVDERPGDAMRIRRGYIEAKRYPADARG